jgi:hypothetical protein
MFSVHKVITRKEVSVTFDDRNITTGLPKNAETGFLPEGCRGDLFEHLHFDTTDILSQPLIENGAEKSSQGFGRHSTAAYAAADTGLTLDERQKADVTGSDLFEESVDPGGVLNILSMYDAQDIARDSVLLQERIPAHRLLIGRLLRLGHPVLVMHLPRTVQAETYGKMFCRQEIAPTLIEEGAVCLNPVENTPAAG